MTELYKPKEVVDALNEQRGCPFLLGRAVEVSMDSVDQMTPDARKQEYYFLLDSVLEPVMDNVRNYRRDFPHGLVKYDDQGNIVSALEDMNERVKPAIARRDFLTATYWAHDFIYRTVDIATEQWLKDTDTSSLEYQRINSLVDDERQQSYGGVAIQKRVSSAANQTVHISCSTQRMTELLAPKELDRPITAEEMGQAHAANMKFAMPMTQLHLLETRPLREVFGSQTLPGGKIEMYSNSEYFLFKGGMLYPNGSAMLESMAEYEGSFPDGRIGCPGKKYVPEIWEWTGELSGQFAMPALDFAEAN